MPNKLVAWAMTHRPQAALAVGGTGAVGVALYRRRRAAKGAGDTTASGVPTSATTIPASGADGSAASSFGPGDAAGGVSYDPQGFDTTASTYLAQISQGIAQLNMSTAALGAAEAVDARTLANIKSTTGGLMRKPAPAPHPKKKPAKPHPAAHHPAPKKKPAKKRRR